MQRNGRRRVGHHDGTDLSRFWVKVTKVGQRLGDTL